MRWIGDALDERASITPDAPALTWAENARRDVLSCAALRARASAVAGMLRDELGARPGEHVLLLYSPCAHFGPAFIGCLLAGVVPVPLPPPDPIRPDAQLPFLAAVIAQTGARIALTDRTYRLAQRMGALRGIFGGARWPDLKWRATDGVRAGDFAPPAWVPATTDTVAFLQYTSGSTSTPKGVAITHGNLAHQLDAQRAVLGLDASWRGVLWVPMFHDLGLVCGLLSACWGNGDLTWFSPLAFLQRPATWMEIVHEVGANITAAPDFAWQLVVRKTTPAERSRWNLAPLRAAMSAAETVRPQTVRDFCAAFAPSGFRPECFRPGYGLAEHTVVVTIGRFRAETFDRAALSEGRAVKAAEGVELTSCGPPGPGMELRIVDPASRCELPPGRVGEIWVDSPSKAAGYWNQDSASFSTTLDDEGRWLRTGDLGFLRDGELFVVGRLKDLVIVGGHNLYPDDIERTARAAHPDVRPGGVLAFSVEGPQTEELVVLVEASGSAKEVAAAVRSAVATTHGVGCRAVVVGAKGLVPKTTSGKPRRAAARDAFRRGYGPGVLVDAAEGTAAPPSFPSFDAGSVQEGLRRVAAHVIGVAPESLDPRRSLRDQGMDSVRLLSFVEALEAAREAPLDPAALRAVETLDDLAAFLQDGTLPTTLAPPDPLRALRPNARAVHADARIAVVGGGPAGLSMAWALQRRGVRNVVVFEAADRLGGKVLTSHPPEGPAEMGQIFFPSGYERALGLAAEMGCDVHGFVGTERVRGEDGWEVEDHFVGLAWMRAVLEAAGVGNRGFRLGALAAAPPEWNEPCAPWLERHGFLPVPARALQLWTGCGYGHVDDGIPLVYLLTNLSCVAWSSGSFRIEGGNDRVWRTIAERVRCGGGEIRTGRRVASVAVGDGPPLVDGETFDHVILAAPPWESARMLPEGATRRLLASFHGYTYDSVRVRVTGMHDLDEFAARAAMRTNDRPGAILTGVRCGPDTWIVYQYAGAPGERPMGDDELDAALDRDLGAWGATRVRTEDRRHWRYFPHLVDALPTLSALESGQGRDGLWMTGGTLAFELLEPIVEHAEGLATCMTGKQAEIGPEADARLATGLCWPDVAIERTGEVLVTGATGFVGVFLLRSLLERTQERVHCVVRAKDDADALRRVLDAAARLGVSLDATRIVTHPGDLGRPDLGLAERVWRRLSAETDAIWHVGAVTSLTQRYDVLRRPNVLGTLDVLRFAQAERPKHLHHVSTFALHDGLDYAGHAVAEDAPPDPPAQLWTDYQRSKWAAEALVRDAVTRGLSATILRLGEIAGDSRTGAWPGDDLVFRVLQACLRSGRAPAEPQRLWLTPVDWVADAMLDLDRVSGTFRLVTPHPHDSHRILDLLEEAGVKLERVPLAEWISGAPGLPQLHLLDGGDAGRSFLRRHGVGLGPDLGGCSATRPCPPVDAALVRTYLARLRA